MFTVWFRVERILNKYDTIDFTFIKSKTSGNGQLKYIELNYNYNYLSANVW